VLFSPDRRPSRISTRQRIRLAIRLLGAMADWPSRLRLIRLKLRDKIGAASASGAPVALRLRPLGGRALHVRPGTSDTGVIVHNYLTGDHPFAHRDLRRICELGSNIGVALAGLAVRHPDAQLLGVEADPENAALARRNLAQFGDRCTLVEAAVWGREAELVLDGDQADLRFVREARDDDPPSARIPARTVGALLAEHMPDGPIDFMHLSIEGSEPRVLAGDIGWMNRVRSIRLSIHPNGFTSDACLAALRRLGFEAWLDPSSGEHGLGVRPSLARQRRLAMAQPRETSETARSESGAAQVAREPRRVDV
jgi:FkbM family methyltransferase